MPAWLRWLGRAAVVVVSLGCLGAQVRVSGRVLDENGVVVAGARVELTPAAGGSITAATSDNAGLFEIRLEAPGAYRIRTTREGFFVFQGGIDEFQNGVNQLVVTLNHLQEFAESVNVTYSPPAIDFKNPEQSKELNNVEILEIPYAAPQDFRSSLPLMNGVVQDVNGKLHFNGGATQQTNFTLNGFNISDPVTGELETRVNIDAVRSLEYHNDRFTAEKGRGSAGSLDIQTGMGYDKWRFGSTNFIPGVSSNDGVYINKWSPRVQVSGPLVKGRAWFHNGFDAFYDSNVVDRLPSGQNRTYSLTASNLSRFQVNLTPSNILTGGFLINYLDAPRHGLSFLDPVETTINRSQNMYMSTIKDQIYFRRGVLLEFGFADTRNRTIEHPQGDRTYEISPKGRSGNYFVDFTRHAYRQEWLSNLYVPGLHWHGTHQVQFGIDFERSSFERNVNRHDYRVLRADNTVARYVTFQGNNWQDLSNFEGTQYIQDRWNPADEVTIDAGVRLDWDQIVRQLLTSPRIGLAWAPRWARDVKIAAGFGIFYDALSLGTLALHQDQVSLSTFYAPNGTVQQGPVETAFLVNNQDLRVPRYRILSFSVERRLPFGLQGKAALARKVGSGGFTFVNQLEAFGAPNRNEVLYTLRNWRHDRYTALEFSLRRNFGGKFEWFGGYTRSRSRSDAVVDYSLEDPIFARQAGGPLSWDTPNRFLTWGWAPIPKTVLPGRLRFLVNETDVAYLVEYRTGFPFSAVNDEGYLVGAPNSLRYPSYFNVNLHLERKFRFMHYLWAWRAGINNLTNSGNPNVVNNNVDSPNYLSYGRGQLRAVAVRLRFLGKR
jgi:hypothetical protein